MQARKMLTNASYFAFTATPKNKTLQMFGEPLPPDAEGKVKHRPFHSYTMKQAIQEGFILDGHHAKSLNKILASARGFSGLIDVYGRADGKPWTEGDRLVQPELGKTLRLIDRGPEGQRHYRAHSRHRHQAAA